jgi:hypothetical protein
MTPQAAEVGIGMVYIYGIPDDSHNCDEMGCSSVAHIIARVPLVDRTYRPIKSPQSDASAEPPA